MLALPTGKVAGVRNVFSFSCTGLEDRLPLRDQRLSGNGSRGRLRRRSASLPVPRQARSPAPCRGSTAACRYRWFACTARYLRSFRGTRVQ